MDFNLHISLGNAAMQTPDDVAAALETCAERLRSMEWPAEATIRDLNGNTVGNFKSEGDVEFDLMKAAHKLTGVMPDNTEEALDMFWGNGVADEAKGSVDRLGHMYRVERWTVTTNSQGFTDVTEHDSVEDAEKAFEEFPEADEE